MQKLEVKEEEFDEALNVEYRDARKRAIDSALYLVKKEFHWVLRYYQARMNELLVRDGIRINEKSEIRIEGNKIIMTIEGEITEDTIKEATDVILRAKRSIISRRTNRRKKYKAGTTELLSTVKGG